MWLGSKMKQIILTFTLISLACISSAKTRTYYVAVLEVFWDYAPSGLNQKTLQPLNEDPYVFELFDFLYQLVLCKTLKAIS